MVPDSISPIDAELLEGLRDADPRRMRLAISFGANPNGEDQGDSFFKELFCESNAHVRISMLRFLNSLGGKPAEASDPSTLLCIASFSKSAEDMAFLLDHRVNPNGPGEEEPVTTYDYIEFDYRFDLWDLQLPFDAHADDQVNEDAWIDYLHRCADATGKENPEQLRLLRRYGALTYQERKERRHARDEAGILQRVVSGGQTGADRAALDWAILENIPHGGWCPQGRLAEDGPLPSQYTLTELADHGYRQRTQQNVIDSDATLIVNLGKLDGGSLQTSRFAKTLGKHVFIIQASGEERYLQAQQVNEWLHQHRVVTLNVAGPRESKRPGIYRETMNLLSAVLGCHFSN
jgi:hypothetical protein